MMNSIYRQALGSDFDKLHPEIQKRFGYNSQDRIACIGTGIMEKLWHGRFYTYPFLYLGTWRNIMFPQKGKNIPFSIRNYAFQDTFGRETVSWIRTFRFPKQERRFDATMIYSNERKKVIDYLGTHQHLAVDIEISVAENGGILLQSGEQRFYEGLIGFRYPLFFSGIANVSEWYDEKDQRFHIAVSVKNKYWGDLFGYKGTFTTEWLTIESPEQIPKDIFPIRGEKRE